MSEPWLRIYPAEMRSDPKIALLSLQEQALLPHAWDMAKNDSPIMGELRCIDGAPMPAKMFAELIPGAGTALARRFMEHVVQYSLAETADDGAIRFATLERRQNIDPTNAARQKRFRSSQSNGDRNGTEVDSSLDGPPPPPAERGESDQGSRRTRSSMKRGSRDEGTNPRAMRKQRESAEKTRRRLHRAAQTFAGMVVEDGLVSAQEWLRDAVTTEEFEKICSEYSPKTEVATA